MGSTVGYRVRFDPLHGSPVLGEVAVTMHGDKAYVEAACRVGREHRDFYDIELVYEGRSVMLRSESACYDLDGRGVSLGEQRKQGTFVHLLPSLTALLHLKVEKQQVKTIEALLAA